jgi:hypothetical protein
MHWRWRGGWHRRSRQRKSRRSATPIALGRADEWQPHYLVTEIRVCLHDGVFGALGFFDGLAAFRVCGVDGRPIRCEKDWVAISACTRLLQQMRGERVADEVGAGEGVADAAVEVDGSLQILRGLCAICGNRPLHQEIGEARRFEPRNGIPPADDLFLDDGAGVFRNAGVAAAGEFGERRGFTAAWASGDDVEGRKISHLRLP